MARRAVPPIVITVTSAEAAAFMRDLLDDYLAELETDAEPARVVVPPLTDFKRGTVLYRAIQASRTVAKRYPEASLFLITEDGQRWRLPPPAL